MPRAEVPHIARTHPDAWGRWLCAPFSTLAGVLRWFSRTLAAAASHPSPPYDSRPTPAAAPALSFRPPTASALPATLPPVPSPRPLRPRL